ncbi:MAG: P-loop NTPase [Candidatus Methanomethyliaceae archaeon]|nr:P-loop NTPase [Candidatus Methanomethyliaceae archaeon]
MGKFITIHSFKGGTGKSYLSVNLSTIYALRGKKVALLDLISGLRLYEVFGNKTSTY